MRSLGIISIIFCLSLSLTAQEEELMIRPLTEAEAHAATPKIFAVVEKMPEFPGGDAALFKYLGENLMYPEAAKKRNISGTVFVQFVVTETGDIDPNSVRVVKGVDPLLDGATLLVVRSFPKWTPGYQNDKPVAVYYNLPVRFMLDAKVEDKKKRSAKKRKG